MDELKKYGSGDVMNLPDLHPVIRGKENDTAQIAKMLMEMADEVRKKAYSPYSKYSVGAALLCMDGTIYTGCNVETAAMIGTCAERNALFKAVSEGKKTFAAIAISGGPAEDKPSTCSPCGVCRQVLSEFVNPDEFIVIFRDIEDVKAITFGEIMPFSFGPANLKQ